MYLRLFTIHVAYSTAHMRNFDQLYFSNMTWIFSCIFIFITGAAWFYIEKKEKVYQVIFILVIWNVEMQSSCLIAFLFQIWRVEIFCSLHLQMCLTIESKLLFESDSCILKWLGEAITMTTCSDMIFSYFSIWLVF